MSGWLVGVFVIGLTTAGVCGYATEPLATTWRTIEHKQGDKWQAKAVYPRFGGRSALVDLANRTLRAKVENSVREFEHLARHDFAKPPYPIAHPYTLALRTTISIARPDLVSAYMEILQFTGGAHGSQSFAAFTFAVVDGEPRQLKLRDLFVPDANAARVVSDLLIPKLKAMGASYVVDGTVTAIGPDLLEVFVVTPTGLTFLIPPYVLGPYSDGSFIVKSPFGELGAALDPNSALGPLLHLDHPPLSR